MHSCRPVAADCCRCLALCLQYDEGARYVTITGCTRTPGKFRVTTFTANSRYSSGNVNAELSTDGVGSYFYRGAPLHVVGAFLGGRQGVQRIGHPARVAGHPLLAGILAVAAPCRFLHVPVSHALCHSAPPPCCRPHGRRHLGVQPQH